MSKEILHIGKEKELVPVLRFKEFDKKWEIITLNDCIILLTDYHANGSYERLKENVELHDNEEYAVMIRTTNFEKKNFNKNLRYINEHAYNYLKKSKVFTDDIIINKIANAGATYLMPELNRPVSLAMNLFLLRIDKKYSAKYIYLQIKVKEYKLRALASGTGTKTITKQDVRSFKVMVPVLNEQKKIATFLSSIDQKIQELRRKKELLETYKKGLMQQLFSGELRFKDAEGKDYPDWEEKRLGEICTFFSGGTPKSTNRDFYSGNIPFIGSGNIYDSEVFNYISEEALNNSSAKIVDKGDLLYALYGANSGEVAISKMSGAINQAILCIRSKKDINYLYYFLLFNKNRIVTKYLQGGQGNLSAKIIKRLSFSLPSLEEQQKNSFVLSTIDKKIESITTQITKTQTFKKGLLQQLFV